MNWKDTALLASYEAEEENQYTGEEEDPTCAARRYMRARLGRLAKLYRAGNYRVSRNCYRATVTDIVRYELGEIAGLS